MAVKYVCNACGATMSLGSEIETVKCPVCRLSMHPSTQTGGVPTDSKARPPGGDVKSVPTSSSSLRRTETQAKRPVGNIKVAQIVHSRQNRPSVAAAPPADNRTDTSRHVARKGPGAPVAGTEPGSITANIGGEFQRLLQNARQEAREIRERVRQQAEEEADNMIIEARAEAEVIKNQAREEAVSEAHTEIQNLRLSAQEEAQSIVANAQKKAQEEAQNVLATMAKQREEAEASLKELRQQRQQTQTEVEKMKTEAEQEARAARDEIIKQAETEASKLTAEAMVEIEGKQRQAELELNEQRETAGKEAQAIADQARQEAAKTSAEAQKTAQAEADKIMADTQAKIAEAMATAKMQADEILETARRQAQELLATPEVKKAAELSTMSAPAAEQIVATDAAQADASGKPLTPTISTQELKERKELINSYSRREARFIMVGMSFSMLILLYGAFVLFGLKPELNYLARLFTYTLLVVDAIIFTGLFLVVRSHYQEGIKAEKTRKERMKAKAEGDEASSLAKEAVGKPKPKSSSVRKKAASGKVQPPASHSESTAIMPESADSDLPAAEAPGEISPPRHSPEDTIPEMEQPTSAAVANSTAAATDVEPEKDKTNSDVTPPATEDEKKTTDPEALAKIDDSSSPAEPETQPEDAQKEMASTPTGGRAVISNADLKKALAKQKKTGGGKSAAPKKLNLNSRFLDNMKTGRKNSDDKPGTEDEND